MLCALEKSELKIAAELYSKTYNVNNLVSMAILEGFADTVLAQKDDSGLAAILCAAGFTIGTSKAVLLHGAAFASGAQKIALQPLMQHARATLQADNYFVKMSDELQSEYQWPDMSNIVSARMLTRDIRRNLWAKAAFDTITAKKLIQHREKYIKEEYIKLTMQQATALMTCLYSQGISSAESDNAYALYYRTAAGISVAELYADTDNAALLLLEAIADHEGRNTAQLVLSESNILFAGEGKRLDYASYSGSEINKNNIYLGPMPK